MTPTRPAGALAPALLAALVAASPARALAPAPDPASDPAYDDDPRAAPAPVQTVVVTGERSRPAAVLAPSAVESVTAEQVRETVNAVTVEDALRYMPSVFVRQRNFGDDQDPIATRTSGVGASARSLIYADGVLLSALIGNNNGAASPHWQLVAPEAVARIDVLYGPFSAAYPGNSTGAVVEITTKAPAGPEASFEAQGVVQGFHKYADDLTVGAARFAGSVGDRRGPFSFRLAYNHLSSDNQPLSYATAVVPAAASTAGTPVTGYAVDANRLRAPIDVLGSVAVPHHEVDTVTGRLTYDLTPTLTAAYTFGLFRNDEDDTVASYLRDAAGSPVYAGSVNLGGRNVALTSAVFSPNVYHLEEDQLAQGLSLASHTGGVLDFEVIGTRFDTLKSRQRTASGPLPAAFTGGPGSTLSLDGTGWWTLDARGTWRPGGSDASAHVLSFGAHADDFKLNNPRYALADWIEGPAGATQSFSRGHTETQGVWVQDRWRIAPAVTATLGLRLERWRAYDGLNFTAGATPASPPAQNAVQPEVESFRASPKATLAWAPGPGWTLKASLGWADRFPTVQELYQSVTTGGVTYTPNPNLKPERVLASELSAERTWSGGRARLSLFSEDIDDALISQTGQIATGPNTFAAASFVQNVGHDRSRGVEVVAAQDLPGRVNLSGWLTYVETRITRDSFAAAVGKQIPQVPRLRGAVVASWRPTDRVTATLAARYSDRSFGTIDNSDTYADTYQGFGAWFVADAHLRWRVTDHVSVEAGINNLTDRRYFVFHPFPGRTCVAGLKWTL